MFLLLLILITGGILMATFSDVKAQLEQIQVGVDALETAIAELKQLVADGHVITQAELDELSALAANVNTDIADPSDQG